MWKTNSISPIIRASGYSYHFDGPTQVWMGPGTCFCTIWQRWKTATFVIMLHPNDSCEETPLPGFWGSKRSCWEDVHDNQLTVTSGQQETEDFSLTTHTTLIAANSHVSKEVDPSPLEPTWDHSSSHCLNGSFVTATAQRCPDLQKMQNSKCVLFIPLSLWWSLLTIDS
jgi:hypothetical protein